MSCWFSYLQNILVIKCSIEEKTFTKSNGKKKGWFYSQEHIYFFVTIILKGTAFFFRVLQGLSRGWLFSSRTLAYFGLSSIPLENEGPTRGLEISVATSLKIRCDVPHRCLHSYLSSSVILGWFSNRTGTSVDDGARISNNWLDQWQSGKLGTGSRV